MPVPREVEDGDGDGRPPEFVMLILAADSWLWRIAQWAGMLMILRIVFLCMVWLESIVATLPSQ